jgi:hypothetical protein
MGRGKVQKEGDSADEGGARRDRTYRKGSKAFILTVSKTTEKKRLELDTNAQRRRKRKHREGEGELKDIKARKAREWIDVKLEHEENNNSLNNVESARRT